MDPQDFNRLHLPFSWHVAAELCWRVPGCQVFETWPIAGHYDCLSVWGPQLTVDINRGGSIHAMVNGVRLDDPPVPMNEVRDLVARPDGVAIAVDRMLTAHGLGSSARRPASTALTVMYRVIAQALSTNFFRQHLDCRSLAPMSEGTIVPETAPAPDFASVPANEVWLLGGEDPAVYLARGWAVTADGDRINLLASYDRGETVEGLAARIMATGASRRSEPLTAGRGPVGQALPVWPQLFGRT